jgi:hypothetical protein
MTHLIIEDVEAELLREVLRAQLVQLRVEIHRADIREYRAHLEGRQQILEDLLRRIPVQVTVAGHDTPPIL